MSREASHSKPTTHSTVRDATAILLLTSFGLGRAPLAPGTVGSLAPPVVALLLLWLGMPALGVDVGMVLLLILGSAVCLRFGGVAERAFGRKDPSQVVADEVAGQAIPLLLLPWASAGHSDALRWNVALAAAAFLLFRLFDVAKPPPIRGVQRVEGGLGILIDDVIAGFCAAVVLQVALFVASAWGFAPPGS